MTHHNQPSQASPAFESICLAAYDFDETVARTISASPRNGGIEIGYEAAIEVIAGLNGVKEYRQSGGLKNRAPMEIINELFPDADETERLKLHDELIANKLEFLLDQIDSEWPQPVDGYPEFVERLDILRRGYDVDDAIISSGHELFIGRVYDEWGIRRPTFSVTVETMQRLGMNDVVKPSAELMNVTRSMWRTKYGIIGGAYLDSQECSRILYAGDDLSKDGELAKNSGIDFVHIKPEDTREGWLQVISQLQCKVGSVGIRGASRAD